MTVPPDIGEVLTADAQGSAALTSAFDAARSRGLNVQAIVDPASHPDAWARFGPLAESRGGGSLLLGMSEADQRQAAPLLVPLEAEDAALSVALVRVACTSPAVVWLASALDVRDLKVALTAKLDAELSDGQEVVLRFYDPRVLPGLLSVFDAQQECRLNEGVAAWWWIDREGRLCRRDCGLAGSRAVGVAAGPIELKDAQVDALLEATFLDRVMNVLQGVTPGAWEGWTRAQRQRIAADRVRDASQWNLTSEFDCASYIAVALQQGPGFAALPEWSGLMERVKAGTLRFSDAIGEWEQRGADRSS